MKCGLDPRDFHMLLDHLPGVVLHIPRTVQPHCFYGMTAGKLDIWHGFCEPSVMKAHVPSLSHTLCVLRMSESFFTSLANFSNF